MNMDNVKQNIGNRGPDEGPCGSIYLSRWSFLVLVIAATLIFSGCETEDCVNCIDIPPPVVPTGVHSISRDNEVWVQWYDLSYFPYDGQYNENVVSYIIYSRFYQDGDEYNSGREFYYIGEVAWDAPFDQVNGLHKFVDSEAVNGERYEYAVASVNASGHESALSYELVTDAPLPHSLAPETLYDANGGNAHLSQFDFSLMDYGRDQGYPGFNADIQVYFEENIPYVQTVRQAVVLQDFGVFTDSENNLIFEGVSWAPESGYSSTGNLELIPGHIYVVKISEYPAGTHYAKFGVLSAEAGTVEFIWAYQTIAGLPELSVPDEDNNPGPKSELISL
ncbi:MAG: hypothetical protein GY780_13705 [bacterium]|nr:hypothetical protein [bacterium]